MGLTRFPGLLFRVSLPVCSSRSRAIPSRLIWKSGIRTAEQGTVSRGGLLRLLARWARQQACKRATHPAPAQRSACLFERRERRLVPRGVPRHEVRRRGARAGGGVGDGGGALSVERSGLVCELYWVCRAGRWNRGGPGRYGLYRFSESGACQRSAC